MRGIGKYILLFLYLLLFYSLKETKGLQTNIGALLLIQYSASTVVSEPGVSTFQPSPLSILEVGGQWLMGLTQSSSEETHLTVASILLTPLCPFGLLVSQPNFTQIKPMASFVPKVQSNQAAFCAGITFKDHILFRAPSYQLNSNC